MKETEDKEKRALPEIEIEGTIFLVDVQRNRLWEKDDSENDLYLFYMNVSEKGYSFSYDKVRKSYRVLDSAEADCTYVTIKPLVLLDPEGMATKYGYSLDELKGKTDYQVMVDQDALAKRLQGQLPTIEIAGHTYFIDYQMQQLRPKDDVVNQGISFNQLLYHFNVFTEESTFAFDPKKREIREPDYETITEIPKDLVVVTLPAVAQMDPVGHARKFGLAINVCAMEHGMRLDIKAKETPWEKTALPEIIKGNKLKAAERKKSKRRGKGL